MKKLICLLLAAALTLGLAACAEKTIVLEYGRLARITENAPRAAEAEAA